MNKKGESLKKLYQEFERTVDKKTIHILFIADDKPLVNYSPSYQRNYIWSDSKAIKLMETIILKREVPPLTVVESKNFIEIIDGRQRYESVLRFINDEFALKFSTLSPLRPLNNLKYSDLPPNIKDIFDGYRLKFIVYKVREGSKLEDSEIEYIKRDLFRRYNYGMTALTKSETARAKYLYDDLTNLIREEFLNNLDLFDSYVELYLPSKVKLSERDKINLLLVVARELLSIFYIPIMKAKNINFSSSTIEQYYEAFVKKENIEDAKNEFFKISNKLLEIKSKLSGKSLFNNVLFFKSVYWMLSLLYKFFPTDFYKFDTYSFCHYLDNGNNAEDYYNNYKSLNSDHITRRHLFVSRYLTDILNLNFDEIFEHILENRSLFFCKSEERLKRGEVWYGIRDIDQIITKDDRFTIKDLVYYQKQNQLIVRSNYQRGEVRNLIKASKIIESMILGVRLPPIYAYVRTNNEGKPEYTIIDGQQRLISVFTFIGEKILDENHDFLKTYKNEYALTGLKDLDYLNGKKFDKDDALSSIDKQTILDYGLDFILIDENNEDFDPVDMFLRVNENPCTINQNCFEMWNSYDIVDSIKEIKNLSKYALFQQKCGNSMKEEELVTVLAFMNKEKISFSNYDKFFNVHLYTENKDEPNERVEVKISIRNKYTITKYLEEIVAYSDDERVFKSSLESVQDFINKLDILVDSDYEILIKIVNPYLACPRRACMKDFYLLWMIFEVFDNHILKTYRLEIIEDLAEIYKLMKSMPPNKDIAYFFLFIKNKISKYL